MVEVSSLCGDLADRIHLGYLPAEHIETPTERLARLNKHRNIDVCLLARTVCSGYLSNHLAAVRDDAWRSVRKDAQSVEEAEKTKHEDGAVRSSHLRGGF